MRDKRPARLVAARAVEAHAKRDARVAAERVAPNDDGRRADPSELVHCDGRIAVVGREHYGVAVYALEYAAGHGYALAALDEDDCAAG